MSAELLVDRQEVATAYHQSLSTEGKTTLSPYDIPRKVSHVIDESVNDHTLLFEYIQGEERHPNLFNTESLKIETGRKSNRILSVSFTGTSPRFDEALILSFIGDKLEHLKNSDNNDYKKTNADIIAMVLKSIASHLDK